MSSRTPLKAPRRGEAQSVKPAEPFRTGRTVRLKAVDGASCRCVMRRLMVLSLRWPLAGIVLALAWSAVAHALLDRRWPGVVAVGAHRFAEVRRPQYGRLNGLYAADQALLAWR